MEDFVCHNDFESLVLGCTHYPLIASHIKSLYPRLKLYSSSTEVIDEAAQILTDMDMLASETDYDDRFYASDLSDNFLRMTELLPGGKTAKIKLKQLKD